MTLRTQAADFLMKLGDAAAPLHQDPAATVTIRLRGREVSVLYAALREFTEGQNGWQPIATLPTDEEWDIRDHERSDDVSLARSMRTGEPLFFLLQEEKAGGGFEMTKWRDAFEWPKPPPNG